MKSGLEGRNNTPGKPGRNTMTTPVSMKSGLEGRNNLRALHEPDPAGDSLNEVRPRRPEQLMLT